MSEYDPQNMFDFFLQYESLSTESVEYFRKQSWSKDLVIHKGRHDKNFSEIEKQLLSEGYLRLVEYEDGCWYLVIDSMYEKLFKPLREEFVYE